LAELQPTWGCSPSGGSPGRQAELVKVTDCSDILAYPILSLPGLVINEKLFARGAFPTSAKRPPG